MIVIIVSECPPKLRGDLSKWLLEINTGVYVGNVNARIREELWQRIIENIGHGRATMVYRVQNEQHLEFKIHNTSWEPVDFDGLNLIKRPHPKSRSNSNASSNKTTNKKVSAQAGKSVALANRRKQLSDDYVVVDIETTGLSFDEDRIIELGAIYVKNNIVIDQFSTFVLSCAAIPPEITKLTGITIDMLREGLPLKEAMEKFCAFISSKHIVCHNAPFDITFIQAECKREGIKYPRNPVSDTLVLARKKIGDVSDYKLETIAKYLGIATKNLHRALNDCELTHNVYMKLNEI